MVNRITQYDPEPEPDDGSDEMPPTDDDFEWRDDDFDDDGDDGPDFACATVGALNKLGDEFDDHLKTDARQAEIVARQLRDLRWTVDLLVFVAVCAAGGWLGWLIWGHR